MKILLDRPQASLPFPESRLPSRSKLLSEPKRYQSTQRKPIVSVSLLVDRRQSASLGCSTVVCLQPFQLAASALHSLFIGVSVKCRMLIG